MNLQIISELKNPDESDFEILERKGRGHPDTLTDRLAEHMSRAYSVLTQESVGTVLRHQFDKTALLGGKCDVRFGGGNFVSPIRLLICGRASPKLGSQDIPFRDLLIKTAQEFLEAELKNFDFLSNCRILLETSTHSTRGMTDIEHNGTSSVHFRFRPRTLADVPEHTRPLSNDTALGCGFAPYSKLENLVLMIEDSFTSDSAREKYPWMGSDVKIMAFRVKGKVKLTISAPQISTAVASISEYTENCKSMLVIAQEQIAQHSTFQDVDITLNPGDDPSQELIYLRYTGSCIESGDEGQVGRGNRMGGIISSRRPFSMEGLSGKNPAYHAGKIYTAAAWDIAQKIWKKLGVPCEVYIASQIDRPLDDPWMVTINTEKLVDESEINKIIAESLGDTKAITAHFLKGEIALV